MQIGDYVKIVDDPFFPILNGLIGRITGIEEWEGQTLYRIDAENYGPYMSSGKKVRAWIRGNWRRVPLSALEEIK